MPGRLFVKTDGDLPPGLFQRYTISPVIFSPTVSLATERPPDPDLPAGEPGFRRRTLPSHRRRGSWV